MVLARGSMETLGARDSGCVECPCQASVGCDCRGELRGREQTNSLWLCPDGLEFTPVGDAGGQGPGEPVQSRKMSWEGLTVGAGARRGRERTGKSTQGCQRR